VIDDIHSVYGPLHTGRIAYISLVLLDFEVVEKGVALS
jgi:hypothetical protein